MRRYDGKSVFADRTSTIALPMTGKNIRKRETKKVMYLKVLNA